jgi:FkbM family methyltransferase
MSALAEQAARRFRRAVTIAAYARGRVAELVPPPAERCGTSPAVGAPRVLAASLRQLHSRGRDAVISLDGGPLLGVDFGTPHGRRLFGYGFCEPAARFMQSLLKPGDVVIDGGANIGLFTLLAAAGVGSQGRVIACEPSPTTMRLLRANVDRNGFDWVELREVALASEPGRLRLRVFTPGSGFSSFAPADTSTGVEVEVEVATLDDVASEVLERLKLVKLDVEGAELLALRGAPRVLHHARPDFIVELEPEHLERQGGSIAEVQELFDEAGYVGYSIRDGCLQRLPSLWQRPAGDPNIVVRPGER